MSWFSHLFSTAGFEARSSSLAWSGGLISLHVVSSILIGIAFLAIASTICVLAYRARGMVPFSPVLAVFIALIVCSGLTRFADALTLWVPAYWFSGALKALTATVSVATAIMLPAFIPRTMAMLHAAKTESATTAALRESEERFRSSTKYSAIGKAIVGLDGRFLEVNDSLGRILGRSSDQLIGITQRSITHTDDQDTDQLQSTRLADGEIDSYEIEKRYLHASGRLVWVQLNRSVVRDPSGQSMYFIAQIQDISDRKLATIERVQLEEHFRASMTARTRELEKRNRTALLMGQLTQRLPACSTQTELAEVVGKMCEQIFSGSPGALYVSSHSEVLLQKLVEWGEHGGAVAEFAPESCWALRRGQSHIVGNTSADVTCPHVSQDRVHSYRCVPLVAQGKAVGVFYLESTAAQAGVDDHDLDVLAEVISLSLVNLSLRETLRHQSIRDPLTGLFNRRHLIEMLDHECARTERTGLVSSMLMVDIDHFKRFNDSYGHDAGDSVMTLVSATFQKGIRKSDLACRYGGEEFAILLPETSLSAAGIVGEKIRLAIRAITPNHRGVSLEPVTISLGLAEHVIGARPAQLIEDADQALYAAKRAGRDRLEIFGGPTAAADLIVRDRELPGFPQVGMDARRGPQVLG